ncbi:MAG: hypothetical protein AMJ89_03835 [candidate division Zixibacteria bacterium SM23_73]|nr:MAG: hypothetical protein AMJ89_03835 [candidate division Zixibacteria bacterium SM23_73]
MLDCKKIIFMAVFALGYVFLSQMAFGMDPFDIEKCNKETISSKAKPDHFSFERTDEKLKREQNRFCFIDSESWPQFFIDTSIVYDWAYGYQRRPAIVWGGGNYLVVWGHYFSNYYLIDEKNIYFTRVSSDGEILDSIRVPISDGPEDQYVPSAAWDGTNYFVVWQDSRSGNHDIYGAKVTIDGEILDPDGIPVCTTGYDDASPAVAWDGTNYLVVWYGAQDGDSTASIYGVRVTPEGEILDSRPIFISGDTLHSNLNPAIAFDGTNYLVVWEDGGG